MMIKGLYSARIDKLRMSVGLCGLAIGAAFGPGMGAKPCALACVGLDVGLWKVLQLAGKLSANGHRV